MGHGGFKLQVQQRIIKTSHEMPGDKPWKRWKTKNVSHFPTARLRLSLWIYSRNLLHLEFECAHGLLFLILQVPVFPYCPTSASLYMYLIADLYTRVLVRPRTLSVLRSYHSMQPSTCSPSSSTITICVCD